MLRNLLIKNYEGLDKNCIGCIIFWCSENFFIPMNNSQLWLLWYAPSNLSLSVAHALLPLGVDELENWHPSFKTLFHSHIFQVLFSSYSCNDENIWFQGNVEYNQGWHTSYFFFFMQSFSYLYLLLPHEILRLVFQPLPEQKICLSWPGQDERKNIYHEISTRVIRNGRHIL